MKLLRSFPVLAFGLVLLSIAGLCTAQRNVGLLLVAGILAALSWYVTEGPRGRTLPRWVSNVLVVAFSLWVFVDLLQNHHDVLGVLGRYAVLLTLVKLYERRTARDYAHLLTLSLLLMMTACLQSNDLLFGVMLIAYAALGLYVLLLYQLYASFEVARNERLNAIPQDYRLVPPLKPIIGRDAALRFRAQAISLGLAGIMVSLMVFVAFPRDVGANMLGLLSLPQSQRRTQFTWNIDLNIGGRITDSRVKVFDVQLLDSNGSALRHDGPLLLRGASLDEYQGRGQWRTRPVNATGHPLLLAASDFTFLADVQTDNAPVVTQRFALNRPADGMVPIFSMYAPVAVAANGDVTLMYDRAAQTIKTDEGSQRLTGYTVQARSAPSDDTLRLLTDRVRPSMRSWFDLKDQQALSKLADSVLAAANVATVRPEADAERWQWYESAARALTNHFQSSEFMYTTDLSTVVYPSADFDPIVRFLTTTKRGHCEFFASGLAALCHSKGIPARVIAGYVAYDYDDALQHYTVLESNAHAWVEVAVGEYRWQSFDPTPPNTLRAIHSTSTTVADQVRWAYQRLEGNWSNSVVNFNSSAQSQLAESFNRSWSRRFASNLESIRAWMERVNQAFYFGPAGYIWMGIVGFALVIAIVALVKLMRRSIAIRNTLQLQHLRGSEYQRMLRQLGFYLDMLRVLDRGGLSKPTWQPPLEFSKSLHSHSRAVAELVREITEIFYEARYGRQRLTTRELQGVRQMVQELAVALHVKA